MLNHPMKKLIGGNWKMNASLSTIKTFKTYDGQIPDDIDVFIAVPYCFFNECKISFPININVAAQDVSSHEIGPYTGEISSIYLKECKVRYVLIGHSERRINHNETNNIINKKIKGALKNSLSVVLCFGEPLEVREDNTYISYLTTQLEECCLGLQDINLDFAYEPIWAIGSGKVADNSQIEEIVLFIKQWMKERGVKGRCLYGGSVKTGNVEMLKNIEMLDGLLVGDSSLNSDFITIINTFTKNIKQNPNGLR